MKQISKSDIRKASAIAALINGFDCAIQEDTNWYSNVQLHIGVGLRPDQHRIMRTYTCNKRYDVKLDRTLCYATFGSGGQYAGDDISIVEFLVGKKHRTRIRKIDSMPKDATVEGIADRLQEVAQARTRSALRGMRLGIRSKKTKLETLQNNIIAYEAQIKAMEALA